MPRISMLSGIILTLGLGLSVGAAEPAPGNWKVMKSNNFQLDLVDCIIKLKNGGGQWTGEVVATGPFAGNVKMKVKSVDVKDGHIKLILSKGTADAVFEGVINNEKKILGSYGDDRRISAGKLLWTEEEKLDRKQAMISKDFPPPLQQLDKLQTAASQLAGKIRQTKDDDEKKKLEGEFADKRKEIEKATPDLLKQVVEKYADDPAALDAAVILIRNAKKNGSTADDVTRWCGVALASAKPFGPRLEHETKLNLAEVLVNNPSLQKLAVEYARQAEQGMEPNSSKLRQVRVLTSLVRALGTSAEAQPFAARLETLETALDEEYIAKHAKLEVEPYSGRKAGGNKTVLLELFTGAQCPPCVAADIAFDKLCENYKQQDLILLQYHLHIPGPDPMTNSDTEARWKYYTDAFKSIGGVPTAVFNGKPDSHDGGGEDEAKQKIKEFRDVIDPILDEQSKAKLSLKAKRVGDDVTMSAEVSDLEEHGDDVKLRFALVEEVVRYAGGNGIRFHHHVVRSMPGGAAGMPLASPHERRQASVNLTALRSTLTKYLDEFVEKRGPFPKPNRPMDMKKLKAVAWIQDDKSENREIIRAVMVDVE